jgi:hypothetical protein
VALHLGQMPSDGTGKKRQKNREEGKNGRGRRMAASRGEVRGGERE